MCFHLETNQSCTRKITQNPSNSIKKIGDWHSHPEAALDTSAIDIAINHEKVVHKLPHGIVVYVITKAILNTVFPH